MMSNSDRKLISVREGATLLNVSEQTIYQALDRETLFAASGPDVPAGATMIEEGELRRWRTAIPRLQRLGRRKGADL